MQLSLSLSVSSWGSQLRMFGEMTGTVQVYARWVTLLRELMTGASNACDPEDWKPWLRSGPDMSASS